MMMEDDKKIIISDIIESDERHFQDTMMMMIEKLSLGR